jgi:hypothetical protein
MVMQNGYSTDWGDRQEIALRQRVDRGVRAEAPDYVYALLDTAEDADRWLPRRVRALIVFDARAPDS